MKISESPEAKYQSASTRPPATPGPRTLILLRHGQSQWNERNLFAGWVDVALTERGQLEAVSSGRLLSSLGILPDVLHTSVLGRAIETAHLALREAGRMWIPVSRSWRLNERHYGALQGRDRSRTRHEFGADQYKLWRRSFDVAPPPIAEQSEFDQASDPRYAHIDGEVPRTESLRQVMERLLPYWYGQIVPDLLDGRTTLVVAHGNSLRALVKHLEGIGDAGVAELNIPTGIPLVYQLSEEAHPIGPGVYLDPEAAAAGAAEVAAQGT